MALDKLWEGAKVNGKAVIDNPFQIISTGVAAITAGLLQLAPLPAQAQEQKLEVSGFSSFAWGGDTKSIITDGVNSGNGINTRDNGWEVGSRIMFFPWITSPLGWNLGFGVQWSRTQQNTGFSAQGLDVDFSGDTTSDRLMVWAINEWDGAKGVSPYVWAFVWAQRNSTHQGISFEWQNIGSLSGTETTFAWEAVTWVKANVGEIFWWKNNEWFITGEWFVRNQDTPALSGVIGEDKTRLNLSGSSDLNYGGRITIGKKF